MTAAKQAALWAWAALGIIGAGMLIVWGVVALVNIGPPPPPFNNDPRAGETTTEPYRYCAAGSLVVFDATSGFSGAWVKYPNAPECKP